MPAHDRKHPPANIETVPVRAVGSLTTVPSRMYGLLGSYN